MKQIQFSNENTAGQQFAKAVRQRVRAYFKENNTPIYANWLMYVKTGVMLSLYLLPFILLLIIPMPPLVALGMAVLIGIGEAGVGMAVMHDAAHGAYSKKKGVNRLVAATMYLLGSNTFNWKLQHNIQHHTFTNIYNHDPDIDTKAIIRLCDHAPRKWYHRFQHYYAFLLYGFMTLLKLVGDVFVLAGHNKAGRTAAQNASPRLEMVKLLATKVVYLAVLIGLPLLLTSFAFWQVLIGFLVIHVVAGMIMSTVFQMAHVVEGADQPLPLEENAMEHNWLVHEMRTTSNFGRNNGILSWYIGGLDFQVEHHLFPNICHVHYPKIAPIVEATAKEFGIPYNLKSTFGTALVSHFRRLRELGLKPVVQGV